LFTELQSGCSNDPGQSKRVRGEIFKQIKRKKLFALNSNFLEKEFILKFFLRAFFCLK